MMNLEPRTRSLSLAYRRRPPQPFGVALLGVCGLLLTAAAARPAAGAVPSSSAVDAPPTYRLAAPSADGIGKFYLGREIAQVMGFEGAPWLERASRPQEERTDWLIEELRLKPDMVVADIGAGSGYLSRRIAPRVPGGKVFAVDVQPEMVRLLERLAQQTDLRNLVPRLGAVDDVQLPENSVDLALFVDVYHELAYPREVMLSVIRALRPGGRIVLVEYRGEDPEVPIKALHKMTVAQVQREMRTLPVRYERASERLPMQHILIFRKPG
jgi:SAM-dependent methyltransferase